MLSILFNEPAQYPLYHEALLAYAGCALLCCIVLNHLVRRWYLLFKLPVLSLLFALILTPVVVTDEQALWAPAIALFLFDIAKENTDNIASSVTPLVFTWIGLFVLGLIIAMTKRMFSRPQPIESKTTS